MPRYVNRDKFMQTLEADKWGFTDTIKVGVALDKTEEDVVPKGEVERLLDEIDGWFMYCENYSGHLIKIKLAERKKKYTEESQ